MDIFLMIIVVFTIPVTSPRMDNILSYVNTAGSRELMVFYVINMSETIWYLYKII